MTLDQKVQALGAAFAAMFTSTGAGDEAIPSPGVMADPSVGIALVNIAGVARVVPYAGNLNLFPTPAPTPTPTPTPAPTS